MKKIIGILVALGLVLSLFAAAVPAMADVEGPVDEKPVVTIPATFDCAGEPGVYNITFNISALVEEGVHMICIDFPDDTVVPPTGADWEDGDVIVWSLGGIWPEPVFGLEVIVTDSAYGTQVCLINPMWDLIPAPDNPITVEFTLAAGIVNPTTAGDYTLFVWTTRLQDSKPIESHKYTIKPKTETYKLVWDSGPTYPGIAKDFIPPFKACGQNTTDTYMEGGVEFEPGKFLNAFNLTFATDVMGCATPCVNVTLTGHLTKAVPGSVVTLVMNTTWFTPTVCEPFTVANITLATNMTVTWNSSLHFDQVGEYEICFNVTCPTEVECQPPGSEVIARECYVFDVKQWKDAYPIDLFRKWNLISLPLVPFETDIDAILAAYPALLRAEILGIWYYDREPCDASEWEQWPAPGVLTDMEDGKAHWVKVAYNHSDPAKAPGLFHGTLWVFGTAAPMPPDSPSAYPVCEGWNMVGFRSMVSMANDAYLWNFWAGTTPLYGMIYGWNAGAQNWFALTPGPVVPADELRPTEGYWIPFALDGTIYPV